MIRINRIHYKLELILPFSSEETADTNPCAKVGDSSLTFQINDLIFADSEQEV